MKGYERATKEEIYDRLRIEPRPLPHSRASGGTKLLRGTGGTTTAEEPD